MTRCPHGGFSLVEVMVGASLVALVMLMLFNLLPSTLVGLRQTEHRLNATMYAQALLETEHGKPFKTLVQEATTGLGAGGATIPAAANPNGPQIATGDDGVQYYSDEKVRLESTYGYPVPCAGCCTCCCPNKQHPTIVIIDVYEYWNEREDDTSLPYTQWHTLTLEQWINDVQP